MARTNLVRTHQGFHRRHRIRVFALALSLLALSLPATSVFAGDRPVEELPILQDFAHVKLSPHAHIESVRLTLDTLDSIYERKIEKTLRGINGIRRINSTRELNLIEVLPSGEVFLDLYDIRAAVNSLRGVKVIRMDVIAAGALDTFQVRHFEIGSDPRPHERKRLVVDYEGDAVFVLVEDKKLDELVASGFTQVVAVGTVPAFEGHVPILKLTDFMKQNVK